MQLDNFLLGSCHVFDTKKFLYGSANSTLKFLKQYTFPARDGKIPITFFPKNGKSSILFPPREKIVYYPRDGKFYFPLLGIEKCPSLSLPVKDPFNSVIKLTKQIFKKRQKAIWIVGLLIMMLLSPWLSIKRNCYYKSYLPAYPPSISCEFFLAQSTCHSLLTCFITSLAKSHRLIDLGI